MDDNGVPRGIIDPSGGYYFTQVPVGSPTDPGYAVIKRRCRPVKSDWASPVYFWIHRGPPIVLDFRSLLLMPDSSASG
jgi:hypothetical protein